MLILRHQHWEFSGPADWLFPATINSRQAPSQAAIRLVEAGNGARCTKDKRKQTAVSTDPGGYKDETMGMGAMVMTLACEVPGFELADRRK